MFHLAPVNFDQRRTAAKKEHHQGVYTRIHAAIQKLKQRPLETVFTNRDVETSEIFKALDALFCHGFLLPPKCYWRFVREFLPQSAQQSLALEWNAHTDRALSMAWLKNALNQQSLHFQQKIMINYYEKTACIRNIPLFKKITVELGHLNEVQFRIETTVQRRQFDPPVAQLSSQTPIVHVPSSSAIDTRSLVKNRAAQHGEIILSASFQHNDGEFMQRFSGTRSMAELAADLPRVEIPSSAHEPFLSTTRDQDYMINEIVKTHRVRVQSRANYLSSEDEEEEIKNSNDETQKANEADSKTIPTGQTRKRSPLTSGSFTARQRRGSSSSSSFSTTSTDDETDKRPRRLTVDDLTTPTNPIRIVEALEQMGKKPIVSLHDELNNTDLITANANESTDQPECLSASSTTANSTPASALSASPQHPVIENIDGDIALSSGEIIQMSLSVFKEDVENFQRLFAVYVDHAVGQPKRRFLLLTDRYLYVLSSRAIRAGEPIPTLSRAAELSYLSSTPAMDSCSFESDEPETNVSADSMQINYHAEVEVSLEDIDYITMGVDAQSVCIHTRTHKFKTTTSDHEQKQFVVETASQMLGACIVSSVQRAARKFTRKHNEIQIVSGTTLYSIILRNFVRRELGLNSVDLKHGALIYWLQCSLESRQTPELLEGYLFTRNFYPNAWRRKVDKWSQKYMMLDRSKLYQFTDSSCKGAELLLNIRERVEEVVEVELKADEKFVLELRFNDDTSSMQLSFTTRDEMQRWLKSLTMILSTAIQDDMQPVACAMILTDTTVLFAQEGANCQVDGFMRLLLQIKFRDIAALASLNTLRHHLLILRRESGDSDAIFLRNESELQRLCSSFANHWQLSVEELSETAAQADPAYSRLYAICCQLGDVWSVGGGDEETMAAAGNVDKQF